MPQTLTDDWKKILGENWEEIQDNYLHAIGNLTLTGYNSTMSNSSFISKKSEYKFSHLDLNRYFDNINIWNAEQIINRGNKLAEQALKIWPSFNESEDSIESSTSNVTGKKPTSLFILNQKFDVSSWKEVLVKTLENTYLLDESTFSEVAEKYPNRIGKLSSKFRIPYDLNNGFYIETNQSAESIRKFCLQIINEFELTDEDWKINAI